MSKKNRDADDIRFLWGGQYVKAFTVRLHILHVQRIPNAIPNIACHLLRNRGDGPPDMWQRGEGGGHPHVVPHHFILPLYSTTLSIDPTTIPHCCRKARSAACALASLLPAALPLSSHSRAHAPTPSHARRGWGKYALDGPRGAKRGGRHEQGRRRRPRQRTGRWSWREGGGRPRPAGAPPAAARRRSWTVLFMKGHQRAGGNSARGGHGIRRRVRSEWGEWRIGRLHAIGDCGAPWTKAARPGGKLRGTRFVGHLDHAGSAIRIPGMRARAPRAGS
eukprot:gene14600-biopygen2772